MNPRTARGRSAAGLVLLVALVAACKGYDPRTESDFPDPDVTPAATVAGTPPATAVPAPSATTAPSASTTASIHVRLSIATRHVVSVDVTDASGTLVSANTGTPGDGASVEIDKLVVSNVAPNRLRLTWVGGPCDSANRLLIDAARSQLLMVQPECHGDAIAFDRVLELTFSSAVDAADFTTSVQDGLDT